MKKKPSPAKPVATRTPIRKTAAKSSGTAPPAPAEREPEPPSSPPDYAELPIGSVFASPLNPRRQMDAQNLEELVLSVAAKGVLQPILVRPASRGRHEIVCGSRRHRACEMAAERGLLPASYEIPARVMARCSDAELVELAATENLAREAMHPLDEAEIFDALRKYVTPAANETMHAAIGRKLGISERSVFRRLSLLRLAPELQKALRAGEINLQQAAAFSIGEPKQQRELWKEARRMEEHNRSSYLLEPDTIREHLAEARVPLDTAFFDLALYTGEIVEDVETSERFFADTKLFQKLQDAHIAARLAELRAEYAWAEFTTEGAWRYEKTKKGDADAGAILVVERTREGVRLEAKAPVIRPEIAAARHRQAERDRTAETRGEPSGAPAPKRLLVEAQSIALHNAKTRALRAGVALDIRAAIALTIMGLFGAAEVKIRDDNQTPAPDRIKASASEEETEARLLRPVLAALEAEGVADIDLSSDFGIRDEDEQAALFHALLNFETDTLLELQAFLVGRRVGSWCGWRCAPGDTPLAIAIAATVDAPRHLPAHWKPDEAWFKSYGRDRLLELVRANDLIAPLNRAGVEWSALNRAKKGALVAACLDVPDGFWTPDKFAECRFLATADMEAAIAAPSAAEPTQEAA